MTRRSLEDIEAHADELADAFESYEPEPEDENAALPPLMASPTHGGQARRLAPEHRRERTWAGHPDGPPVIGHLDAQAASAPATSFREYRPSATAMTRA